MIRIKILIPSGTYPLQKSRTTYSGFTLKSSMNCYTLYIALNLGVLNIPVTKFNSELMVPQLRITNLIWIINFGMLMIQSTLLLPRFSRFQRKSRSKFLVVAFLSLLLIVTLVLFLFVHFGKNIAEYEMYDV